MFNYNFFFSVDAPFVLSTTVKDQRTELPMTEVATEMPTATSTATKDFIDREDGYESEFSETETPQPDIDTDLNVTTSKFTHITPEVTFGITETTKHPEVEPSYAKTTPPYIDTKPTTEITDFDVRELTTLSDEVTEKDISQTEVTPTVPARSTTKPEIEIEETSKTPLEESLQTTESDVLEKDITEKTKVYSYPTTPIVDIKSDEEIKITTQTPILKVTESDTTETPIDRLDIDIETDSISIELQKEQEFLKDATTKFPILEETLSSDEKLKTTKPPVDMQIELDTTTKISIIQKDETVDTSKKPEIKTTQTTSSTFTTLDTTEFEPKITATEPTTKVSLPDIDTKTDDPTLGIKEESLTTTTDSFEFVTESSVIPDILNLTLHKTEDPDITEKPFGITTDTPFDTTKSTILFPKDDSYEETISPIPSEEELKEINLTTIVTKIDQAVTKIPYHTTLIPELSSTDIDVDIDRVTTTDSVTISYEDKDHTSLRTPDDKIKISTKLQDGTTPFSVSVKDDTFYTTDTPYVTKKIEETTDEPSFISTDKPIDQTISSILKEFTTYPIEKETITTKEIKDVTTKTPFDFDEEITKEPFEIKEIPVKDSTFETTTSFILKDEDEDIKVTTDKIRTTYKPSSEISVEEEVDTRYDPLSTTEKTKLATESSLPSEISKFTTAIDLIEKDDILTTTEFDTISRDEITKIETSTQIYEKTPATLPTEEKYAPTTKEKLSTLMVETSTSKSIDETEAFTTPVYLTSTLPDLITPEKPECISENKSYRDGEKVPSSDKCQKCQCQDGQVICSDVICPPPPPAFLRCNAKKVPDLCCPLYQCRKYFFLYSLF